MGQFRIIYESDYTEALVSRVSPMPQRTVFICNPLDSALVLGSSQNGEGLFRDTLVETFNIVKRRSGGGAVMVVPLEQVWIDIFIPQTDPLYESDILKSPLWIGEVYTKTLSRLGIDSHMYVGRLIGDLAGLICFAGLGPGEVTVDGSKVVGISQRRIKDGVWFYTMLPLGNSQDCLWSFFDQRQVHTKPDLSWKSILQDQSLKDSSVPRSHLGKETITLSTKDKLKIENTFLHFLSLI